MSEPKRGALIGCGFFARNHMNAWSAAAGADIVAVCDLDPAKARAMAQDFDVAAAYTDADQMFSTERLDFVDIVTTVESHAQLVELAVRHAPTVICQKPFAETMAEARAMVDTAKAHGANLIVHENFRWQRPFLEMKSRVDDGLIGPVHTARFSFRHGYDNYVNQPYLMEIDRFAIFDVGLHLLDVARHFMGEATHIACTTQRLNQKVKGEDAFTALITHEGGKTSVCDCSFFSRYAPEPFPNTAAVIEGLDGTLELDRYNRLTVHKGARPKTIDVDGPVPDWGARPWHSVQDSVANFTNHAVDVMQGQADPQPSGAHNAETVRLALAAYASAETGQTINLSDFDPA